jgi:uncharacterized membrane protein YqjE
MELVQHATRDAKDLIRLEIALARNELGQELAAARSSAILGAAAIALGLTGLASLVIALGLALGSLASLGVAVLLLSSAAIAGSLAHRRLPKTVMRATMRRLTDDAALLKEHLS